MSATDYSDLLRGGDSRDGGDPTSPQDMPPATGTGALDVGTAAMPSNVEASSAVYWLTELAKKSPQFKPQIDPMIATLKPMAVQIEAQSGLTPPGTPPPAPNPLAALGGGPPPPGAATPSMSPIAAALGGPTGAALR